MELENILTPCLCDSELGKDHGHAASESNCSRQEQPAAMPMVLTERPLSQGPLSLFSLVPTSH
eukprot:676486-Rhodomonas_salina.1